MRVFSHIKPRGAKELKDYLGIKATILANDTMQGINEFSKRSNLKYQRHRWQNKIISILPPYLNDTAGANNVNDLIYYLLGKIHDTRYRSTVKKTESICGFKLLATYEDLLIKLSAQVNTKLGHKESSTIQLGQSLEPE